MQILIPFTFIYLLSTLIGQNMRILTPEPKMIHIQSPLIYTLVRFPYSLMPLQMIIKKEKQTLTLSELLFGIFNQLTLAGFLILQILPSYSCKVIELSAGRRHSWMDVTLDSYNQLIPMLSILFLLCLELLILFGKIPIRAIRDTEFRKKIGSGVLAWSIGLCLLFLIVISFIIVLFFKSN